MGKFKFKYEPIKRVKEQLEKKVQKEVAELNCQIDNCNEEITKLENELTNKKLHFKKSAKAMELQFQKNYETNMLGMIEAVNVKIEELNKQKNVKLIELIEKTKEKKIFIKLEEKHLENFNKEENKIEAERVDEVATQSYIRGK